MSILSKFNNDSLTRRMYPSALERRRLYGTFPRDLSFLLTSYKNFSTDEYSTKDSDGLKVPPLACAFAKMRQHQHIVGIVDEDGFLVLYDTNKTGRSAVIKMWQTHPNAVFDLEWLPLENKILTGSGDQKISLFDVETCVKIHDFKGHGSSVKSLAFRPNDNAVFTSGSRDGHIMVWDLRINKKGYALPPVLLMLNAHTLPQMFPMPKRSKKKKLKSLLPRSDQIFYQDAQQSVTTVLFQNEYHIISGGAVDGCVKVWDIRKRYSFRGARAIPLHTFAYPGTSSRKHGYTSLALDSRGLRLFASCTDDVIYEYDSASYDTSPVRTWQGNKNSSFYVKTAVSPDDQFLLSGSSDECAYIWQINKPEKAPVVLKSHRSEVTGVAWCPNDQTKLVTLSDDAKAKFWRIYCREKDEQLLPRLKGRAEIAPINNDAVNKCCKTKGRSIMTSNSTQKSVNSAQLSIMNWLRKNKSLQESTGETDKAKSGSESRTPNSCRSRSASSSSGDLSKDVPSSQRLKCTTKEDARLDSGNSDDSRNSDSCRERLEQDKHTPHRPTAGGENPLSCTDRDRYASENSENEPPSKRKLSPGVSDDSPKRVCRRRLSTSKGSARTAVIAASMSDDSQVSSSESESDEESNPPPERTLCHNNFDYPTQNLPNLVLDRMTNLNSPTQRIPSPKPDWLTQLRLGKLRKSSSEPIVKTPVEGSPKAVERSPKVVKGVAKISSFFKPKTDQ